MYGDALRSEHSIYEASQQCSLALSQVQPLTKTKRATVKDHHNAAYAPSLFAAGTPTTDPTKLLRLPGMEHNIDKALKGVYKLYVLRTGGKDGAAGEKSFKTNMSTYLGLSTSKGYWSQQDYSLIFCQLG